MRRYTFPPEVLERIIENIPPYSLDRTATVTKQWQAVVERTTFKSLKVDTTELVDFKRIIVSRGRQHLVRNLKLLIVLPEYPDEARDEFETDKDRKRNNRAFTDAIHSIFKLLRGWNHPREAYLDVSLHARSPCDYSARSIEEDNLREANPRDLYEFRYKSSYLEFLDSPETLPMVRAIGFLEFPSCDDIIGNRQLAPATISGILSRLPRVREVKGYLSDDERKDHALRNKLRSEFALSLSLWPTSLEHLDLTYDGWPPQDQSFAPFVCSTPGNDALSLALHRLSQQLVTLTLSNITVGPELFWSPGTSSVSPPLWPKLTSYRLEYTIATPSGKWLFERDPAQIDTGRSRSRESGLTPEPVSTAEQNRLDDSWWRTKPVQDLMTEFYSAASRAAQYMPKLETMALHAQLKPCAEWALTDAAHWFMYDRAAGHATWAGSGDFHLTEDIREMWKGIAMKHGNPALRLQDGGHSDCLPPLYYEKYEAWKEDFGYGPWDD